MATRVFCDCCEEEIKSKVMAYVVRIGHNEPGHCWNFELCKTCLDCLKDHVAKGTL